MRRPAPHPPNPTRRIDDVDFCLELLHSDVINVAYILELIADLNPDSEDYQQKRQQIIDTMIPGCVDAQQGQTHRRIYSTECR